MAETDPEIVKQTAGAQRAMGLAALVNKVFAAERVKGSAAGHGGYRLEMSGPDGPSTTELKKVEDRLELIPVDEANGEKRILVGTADPAMSQADLCSYDRLVAQRAKLGSGEVAVDRADYERVLAKVEAFFDRQGIPVTIARSPVATAAPSAPKRSRTVLVVVGVLVALALAAFAMRHR